MQQVDKRVYVHQSQDKQLLYGKCIMQQLTDQPHSGPMPVLFDCSNDGFSQISYAPASQFYLIHASECPCHNQDFTIAQPKAISLAVVAILRDKDGQYLLTRRPEHMTAFPKCWVFPGGMVDKGDPLEWEVLRELEEEVGINTDGILDTITPIVLYESIYPVVLDSYPKKQTLVLFYLVKLTVSSETLKITPQETEVDRFTWIEEGELKKAIENEGTNGPYRGVYPNEIGEGIGEGHVLALKFMFANS